MLEDFPLISIIIPVYKIETYLVECVNSILEQEFHDYEIILIDDGSPDACPKVCDDFAQKDPRVRVIHKVNEGTSMARKAGLDIAAGRYIFFIDGDDWVTPDCLSVLAKVIKEYRADIVCFGMYYGDKRAQYMFSELPYRKGFYSRDDIINEIFPVLIQTDKGGYFTPNLCSKVIKRALLKENIVADPLATIGEDGATVIPCVFHAASMYVMQEGLYYYRYNEASATKKKKPFNWEYPMALAKHIEKTVDLSYGNFKEQLDRKITHDVFVAAASQFYRKERYESIAKDIAWHISVPYYRTAIEQCRFKVLSKGWMAKMALKYKWFLAIKFYYFF